LSIHKKYYPNSNILSVGIYKDGQLNGPYKSYYENGSVYFFETNQFKQFLKTHPDFQNQFTAQMMQFMHYLKNKTSSLMLLNLKERLMEYLKENGAEHNFIQLNINKNQLALLLNATPESISRTFKALEEENLIEVKGESYKLKSS
jgi:CRP-like cAMP-binding protein